MASDRIRLRWVEAGPDAAGPADDLDDPDDVVDDAGSGDDLDDDVVEDVAEFDDEAGSGASSEPGSPEAVPSNGTGGTAVGVAPRFRVEARPHHALVDAITAVAAAAGLLSDRWDDLTDDQRRELAVTIKRRADDVRGCLGRAAR